MALLSSYAPVLVGMGLGCEPSDRARGDQALPSGDRMLAKDNWSD